MKSEEAQLRTALRRGLVVLFGAVGLTIGSMSPPQMGPLQQLGRLFDNMTPMYFFQAETLAKKLRPDPSLHWSRAFLDPGSGCAYLGYGIWHAHGYITEFSDHTVHRSRWQVYLMSDDPNPLYVQVGNREIGDKSYALRDPQ